MGRASSDRVLISPRTRHRELSRFFCAGTVALSKFHFLAEVRSLFCEVERLLRLLLVLPTSSAADECLRCVMTQALYTTMSQPRLNHTALLNVHQQSIVSLDITAVTSL